MFFLVISLTASVVNDTKGGGKKGQTKGKGKGSSMQEIEVCMLIVIN